MRNFLLTRARTAFWIWSAPAILALLSCAASGLKGWAKAQMHLEFVLDNASKLHIRTRAEELLCTLS